MISRLRGLSQDAHCFARGTAALVGTLLNYEHRLRRRGLPAPRD